MCPSTKGKPLPPVENALQKWKHYVNCGVAIYYNIIIQYLKQIYLLIVDIRLCVTSNLKLRNLKIKQAA